VGDLDGLECLGEDDVMARRRHPPPILHCWRRHRRALPPSVYTSASACECVSA
jgi:hypothetical protein